MSSLTDSEYELIRERANTLVLYWIDHVVDYTTILNELATISSYSIVLNIHMEALDLFMYYLYSCEPETRKQFGIYDTEFQRVITRISAEIDMLRNRIDKDLSVM